MNEIIISDEKIKNMIYIIRGKEVMLDSDLAFLYGCANGTKSINLAVRRNIERFPNDFYFQLTYDEYKEILRFQFETLKLKQGQYSKYLPYVFTEQGVAMLSSVLKTERAGEVSINIMRAFVSMRHFIIENKDIYQSLNNINNKLDNHEEKINYLFSNFKKNELKEKIYYEGSIYDAYSKLIDIMDLAKKELIIIDNYADKTVLDMISKLKVKVLLITKNNTLLNKLDIEKYNKQYNNLTIKYSDIFHDRFIILDKIDIYHLGSSINHAGKRLFAINKLEDKEVIEVLIKKIKNC